jgi:hypothetical protein
MLNRFQALRCQSAKLRPTINGHSSGNRRVIALKPSDPIAMSRMVHAHLKSIMPENPRPDALIFLGGGARPNARFRAICGLAGIRLRTDVQTGKEEPWELKDLRQSCATYYAVSSGTTNGAR